ncbi:hypothetical protein Q7P37_005556 [Cladosporium fusiforme]
MPPTPPTPTALAARAFMASPYIAVAGASSSPNKYGHIIFTWYLSRPQTFPHTPIPLNPSKPTITALSQTHATLPSPAHLPDPHNTSLSIVTPPAVTAEVLREAKEVGVRAVWLQPGSFGAEELGFARRMWPGMAVAGEGEGARGHEGWCVLVDGEEAQIKKQAARTATQKRKAKYGIRISFKQPDNQASHVPEATNRNRKMSSRF